MELLPYPPSGAMLPAAPAPSASTAPAGATAAAAQASIKVGDRVCVKPSVSTPKYKWGTVTHKSVGVVVAISPNGRDVTVDFPQQNGWTGLLSEMEVVPTVHAGVSCDECPMNPLVGPRFKCKTCANFDLCERCFYSRQKGHKHSFNRIAEPSSPAVFAGRPGRDRRRADREATPPAASAAAASAPHGPPGHYSVAGLLEEWSLCVKSMGVSSRESWAYRLTDGTSSYWQSCGSQGKHWIRLEMQTDVLVHALRIQGREGGGCRDLN